MLAYGGASFGALLLALGLLVFGFGGVILNGYGKGKAERAFAVAHPGYALRLGELHYAVRGNQLVARSATLSAPQVTLEVGRITLTGVRWARSLWGAAALPELLAQARLEAMDLDLRFPQAGYGLQCARLQASVPDAELIAEATALQPGVSDDEFFAASAFRKTRFRVAIPECRVLGLAYAGLLQGTSYQARSVHCSRPSFDALVNGDKPLPPFVKSPLMVHEALAAIGRPVRVDSLTLTNGHLTYSEQLVAGTDPAVLTFGAVSGSVQGIANRGEPSAAIQVRAQGDLMEAGTLQIQMSVPITPPDFSLRYSGSLGVMDLTRLTPFLDRSQHVRVKSGSVQEATFEIEVIADQARGHVQAIYDDLQIAVLNPHPGAPSGMDQHIESFLANVFIVRTSNAPDAAGGRKEGTVDYTRIPEDEFLEFLWSALWTGVRDVITH